LADVQGPDRRQHPASDFYIRASLSIRLGTDNPATAGNDLVEKECRRHDADALTFELCREGA